MKKTKKLENIEELLMKTAKEACVDAYAPYSKFHVGAAIRLSSGKIIKGHNIENASYPLCLCAERTALSICSILHPNDPPIAIAINATKDNKLVDTLVSPCGACRQVISETQSRYNTPIKIIFPISKNEYCIVDTITELIPHNFSGNSLI